MISLTSLAADPDNDETEEDLTGAVAAIPSCYSVTIFTQRWKEVRDFYVNLLKATVLSERSERYCEMQLGGIPLTLGYSYTSPLWVAAGLALAGVGLSMAMLAHGRRRVDTLAEANCVNQVNQVN